MSIESNPSPAERFSTPEQAKGLRIAIQDLVTKRGIADRFQDYAVPPPDELLLDLPPAKPFESESDHAVKPAFSVFARQDGNIATEAVHSGEDPRLVAALEIIRGQWINLDKPDPVKGNKENAHALYAVAIESNIGLTEPLYTLRKVIVTDGSSLPLIDFSREGIPQAVPAEEADAVIGYAIELLLAKTELDMSQMT